MKKFKNLNTGLVEVVTNEKLIEQYEKYNKVYVEVKSSKPATKTADKTADKKDADKTAE